MTASTTTTRLSAEEIRQIVSRQLERLNAQDIEGFLEFCEEDAVFTFPGNSLFGGVHQGKEQISRFFSMLFQIITDLRFDQKHIMVFGDWVAIEWEDFGHTFRGEPFDNKGVTVMHLRDGRQIEMRDHLDTEKLAAFSSIGNSKRKKV